MVPSGGVDLTGISRGSSLNNKPSSAYMILSQDTLVKALSIAMMAKIGERDHP